MLNSFRYDREYLASKFTMQFMAWCNTFIKGLENKTPLFHYAIVDSVANNREQQVIQAFRGSGKTTLISTHLVLMLAFLGKVDWFGKVNYILIISDTSSQALDIISDIHNAYEESEELQESMILEVSKMSSGSSELQFLNKNGHRTNIVAKGSGQSMRGIKRRRLRPEIIIVDDLEEDEAVLQKQNRDKLKKWFFKTLMPARNLQRSKIFVVGTPLHSDSLLQNLIDDREWNAKTFPIIDDKGNPAWHDRFPIKIVNKEKDKFAKQGMERAFYQEYMLQIMPDGDNVFKKEDFRYYMMDDIGKFLPNMNIFTSVDLAISQKDTADYTVITTIAVNSDNHWFILNQVFKRMNLSDTTDALFEEIRKYKPIKLVLETVAYQAAFKEIVEGEMLKRNTFVQIETTKKQNKEIKIQRLEPRYKRNAVHHLRGASWLSELEEELVLFRPEGALSKHDDLLDSLAMLEEFAYPPSSFAGNVGAIANEYSMETVVNPYIF